MTPPPVKNPYRPGVGIRPKYLAGRDASINRFAAMLRAAPEQPANMRVTGLRGVGKTVLLQEFEDRARHEGWGAAQYEVVPGDNTNAGFVRALSRLADRIERELSRTEHAKQAVGALLRAMPIQVTWNDITFSFAGGNTEGVESVAKTLYDLTNRALAAGLSGFALLFDEGQTLRDDKEEAGDHALSTLVAAVVALQRKGMPLALVLCGLPTLSGNLLRARSYTERMFRAEVIGSLDADEAREALLQPLKDGPISMPDDVAAHVMREVEGYPYFVQLWGAELWDAADQAGVTEITAPLLQATTPYVYRRLDLEFYEPRIGTLTPAEQDLLLDTANTEHYPPVLVAEVNEVSKKSSSNINVLLGRMVEAGVLFRLRKGQYEYTAPKFRQYLARRARLQGT